MWQCWHLLPKVFILTIVGWHSNILSIERCKKGSWKKENTEEALKCWNLQRIIDAEQQGKDAPSELKLEDLLNEEGADREGYNAKDAEEVTFIN